jgi:hypothetical protein
VLGLALLACLGASALSLLAPHTLTYDPWAWAIWGRELFHLGLDTSVGPSWKPLPVMLDTVFALFGGAEPDLWLVVARTGCLAALIFAYRVAARIAGPAAGVLAVAWLASTGREGFLFGWVTFFGSGWSEGLVAAFALAAVDQHLDGRRRSALLCALAAALMRIEAWPFLALYAVWLWRSDPAHRRLIGATLLSVPVLWVVPDLIGSGELLRAGTRAQHGRPSPIRSAAHPGLRDLRVARDLIPLPVGLGAAVAVAFACVRRQRTVLVLGAVAAAWMLIVAAMTEAGYPGVPRYFVVTVAIACVLGAIGWITLARTLAPARSLRWALIAVAMVVQIVLLVPRASDVEREARGSRREARTAAELNRAVEQAGGSAAVNRCGLAATNAFAVSALAWRLGMGSAVTFHSERAQIVFRGRDGLDGPVAPALPPGGGGFRPVGRSGGWEVLARC